MTEPPKSFEVSGIVNLEKRPGTGGIRLPREYQAYIDRLFATERVVTNQKISDLGQSLNTEILKYAFGIELSNPNVINEALKYAFGIELSNPNVINEAIDFDKFFGTDKVGDHIITHNVDHGEDGASENIPELTYYNATTFEATTVRIPIGRLILSTITVPKAVTEEGVTTVVSQTQRVQIWMPSDTNMSIWVRVGDYTPEHEEEVTGEVVTVPESIVWGESWRKFGFFDLDIAAIYTKLASLP